MIRGVDTRRIFNVCFAVLSVFASSVLSRDRIEVGVRPSLGIALMSGEHAAFPVSDTATNPTDDGPILAYGAAAYAEIPLASKLSTRIELGWHRVGHEWRYVRRSEPGLLALWQQEEIRLQVIEANILGKYTLFSASRIGGGLFFGPGVGWIVDGDVHIDRQFGSDFGTDEADVDITNLRNFQFSIVVGIEMTFPFEPGEFVFDVRYQHGLTRLTSDDDVTPYEDILPPSLTLVGLDGQPEHLKLRSVALSLGARFSL